MSSSPGCRAADEFVAGAESTAFPVFLAGAADIAAENAAKTEYDAINPGTATPQVINVFTDCTRQAALTHSGFEQRLRQKLAALVAAREDVLLQAKVMATVGIQTQAFVAGAQANQVLIGTAKVESAVGVAPDVALVNPADIGLLLGAGIAITPPGELAQLDLQLWGIRLDATTAQTAGFVLVGAWRAPSAGRSGATCPTARPRCTTVVCATGTGRVGASWPTTADRRQPGCSSLIPGRAAMTGSPFA